jgi:hypothetical protein
VTICGSSGKGGLVRTSVALLVLLGFWAALARAYWPEILTVLLRATQSARGAGAREVESAYFEVRDNSSAGQALVHQAVTQLEADYAAIQAFLGAAPDYRVRVLITNGAGPAFTDGARLSVFYDGGGMDLSTAPFFLVALREGDLSMAGVSLFVEGGFAVYVVEEIDRAQPLLGQSSDAWVTWLRENDTLVPLVEAWSAGLPQRERDVPGAIRVLLEGGSFMHWVADTYGLGVVQDLRSGVGLGEAIGLSFSMAEHSWLRSLSSRALRPKSCVHAVPGNSALRDYCEQLDGIRVQ